MSNDTHQRKLKKIQVQPNCFACFTNIYSSCICKYICRDIEYGYPCSIFMASGAILLLIAYIIDKECIINSRLPFIQSCNNKVPKLSSTGGIGTQFVEPDNLRRYKEDGTQYKVRYAFFEFFGLPIFPLGCFATEQTFFNMRYKTTTTYYTIYGKQKQYACELAYIYLRGWGIGIFIIGIIVSLINFFG